MEGAGQRRIRARRIVTGNGKFDRSRFYERFADQFDARMNRYEVNKRLTLVFGRILGDTDLGGLQLLDAGCGTGLFSKAAVDRGAVVTSLDVGERLLDIVAQKCETTRVVGDLMALPFEDRSFEVVLCTEVIEHVPSPRRAVAELARVLRPGGRLILTTPNRAWHWSVTVAKLLRLRPYEGLENWVAWPEVRRWIGEDGLMLDSQIGFNALPFFHPLMYPLIDRLDRYGTSWLGRLMINMLLVAHKGDRSPRMRAPTLSTHPG